VLWFVLALDGAITGLPVTTVHRSLRLRFSKIRAAVFVSQSAADNQSPSLSKAI